MPSESVGFSKSGAEIKDKAPVVSSIANLSLSADSPNDQVTVSFALKEPTTILFSSTEVLLDVSPASPDGPVITGLISSTSVTSTVTVWLDLFPASSVASTTTL